MYHVRAIRVNYGVRVVSTSVGLISPRVRCRALCSSPPPSTFGAVNSLLQFGCRRSWFVHHPVSHVVHAFFHSNPSPKRRGTVTVSLTVPKKASTRVFQV